MGTELGYGLPATRVMAVGFRRHGTSDPTKVPMVLSDYWQGGLAPIHNAAWHASVGEFCNGPNPAFAPVPQQPATPSDGIFRLITNNGVVQVGVSTIHGVKGETMDATLVLSTYFHVHDLQQLIEEGPLRGKRPTPAKEKQVRYQDNVKRAYVAMTRPTRLLCLAIRDDQITVLHRTEMEALGWTFQTV